MQVANYKEINKNKLKGSASIMIPKWGNFIINDILYFTDGSKRWISFPAKEYETKEGQKKYHWYVNFKDPEMTKAFQEKIMKCIEEYLNQPQTKENVFPSSEGVPF